MTELLVAKTNMGSKNKKVDMCLEGGTSKKEGEKTMFPAAGAQPSFLWSCTQEPPCSSSLPTDTNTQWGSMER